MNTLYFTGGTGFIGRRFIQCWLASASERVVVVQTRDKHRARRLFSEQLLTRISFVADFNEWKRSLKNADVDYGVVNLAGAPIADARWSKRRKQVLEESRVALTEALIQRIFDGDWHPKVWVNASAIGYYGSGDDFVDEASPKGEGYAAQLCERWEKTLKELPNHVRTVVLRFGVVLGDGGALKKLTPMYKLGCGGRIGNGSQGFSWVHIEDVASAIMWSIESALVSGVFNVVSPNPIAQKQFASSLGRCLHRPSFVPTPAFVLRLIFGAMAQELLIEGQFVKPSRLLSEGFAFKYPEINPALDQLVT